MSIQPSVSNDLKHKLKTNLLNVITVLPSTELKHWIFNGRCEKDAQRIHTLIHEEKKTNQNRRKCENASKSYLWSAIELKVFSSVLLQATAKISNIKPATNTFANGCNWNERCMGEGHMSAELSSVLPNFNINYNLNTKHTAKYRMI